MTPRSRPLARVAYLPRRPRHGHHPDCPYATPDRDPAYCGPCQGLAKAADAEPEPADQTA